MVFPARFTVLVCVLRYYCYEYKLACLLWKVDIREVLITHSKDITNDSAQSLSLIHI